MAALLLENSSVLGAIRRELRRVVDVLVDEDEIVKVLRDEVIKRDVLEGPTAELAARRVNRCESKQLRVKSAGTSAATVVEVPPSSDVPPA